MVVTIVKLMDGGSDPEKDAIYNVKKISKE
jgi:hypothetical protein